MIEFVLDTSILIPFTRQSNPVAAQIDHDYQIMAAQFRPLISVVTLGEMKAFALAWGNERVRKLESILTSFPIINIDREEVLDAYADLHDLNKKGGCGIGQNDLWIAACARAAGFAVLTSDADLLRLPAGTVKVVQVNAKTGITENSTT